MLPIGDQNPTRSFPFVNYLLIAANVAAFVWQFWLMVTGAAAWLLPGYGLVPSRLVADPPGEAFTVFTSMFMHGGWTHLGGNMLYLYIFGDNVEDAMGHVRYVFFYLLCGVAAAAVQVGIAPFNRVPIVGASGAIAGVLGGYIVLYPRAPVNVVNPVLPLWLVFGPFLVAPAWAVIGIWFVWNLYSGFGQLTQVSSGGVAFFAHIGGFVAGMLMVRGAVAGRRRLDRGRWSGWRGPSRPSWSSRAPRSW